MRIFTKKNLIRGGRRLGLGCEKGLAAWLQIAKTANWKSLEEVRQTWRSTDGVSVEGKTYTVFNIGGNNFRLIVRLEYQRREIYIKHVLTHAEYDKGDWKNERFGADEHQRTSLR